MVKKQAWRKNMASRKKKTPLAQIYHYSRQGRKKPLMADFKICKILRNFHYEIYF